jgi:hypothetical protein
MKARSYEVHQQLAQIVATEWCKNDVLQCRSGLRKGSGLASECAKRSIEASSILSLRALANRCGRRGGSRKRRKDGPALGMKGRVRAGVIPA